MLEGVKKSLEVAHSIVSPQAHAERLVNTVAEEDRQRQLAVATTFARIALHDYQRGDPNYRFLTGDLSYEVTHKGLVLQELGLSDDERGQIQAIIYQGNMDEFKKHVKVDILS